MEEWEIELGKVKSELLDMITNNTRDIVHIEIDIAEVRRKIDELEAKLNDIHERISELEYRTDKLLERLGVKRE